MRGEEFYRLLATARDRVVRQLMGRWVSELEPCVFVEHGTGRILGIGAVGHPKPSILVEYERPKSPHHFPRAFDIDTADGSYHLEWPI